MSKEKITFVIPGNDDVSSIKSLSSIVKINSSAGDGYIKTETYSFDGTIEDKLNQYQEYFGIEYKGVKDFVYSKFVRKESIPSLELGKPNNSKPISNPVTIIAQKKIDNLVKLAQKFIKENQEYKKVKHTRKKLIDRLSSKNS